MAYVIVFTALAAISYNRPALASTACELPAAFSLGVEQRQLLDMRGTGLVVVRVSAPSALRAGDVVRQANGRRTASCQDLEAAAADAVAKGLALLLAIERDGRALAVALPEERPTAAENPAPAQAPPFVPPPPPTAPREPAVAPPAHEPETVVRPAPVPTATIVPRREAQLPSRAEASAELASKAVAAAAVLGTVDEAARLTVPLGVYERRLEEAKNAIGALSIAGEGADAVRAVIAEAVALHETARDIRRYKAAELEHARVDQRGAGAISLPYFSDSDVPRWVERFPFLSESLQQAPRSTHLLLPGEMAGRWNPDQAVELLWLRARATAERLGHWASAS